MGKESLNNQLKNTLAENDTNAFSRKKDHIELAFRSQIEASSLDQRFYYEPLLAAHPKRGSFPKVKFLGKEMRAPIWVSSMTGGTEWARCINQNLARACKEFGMGMGLGSCRSLLYSEETFPDFNVRHLIGDDLPLFANLGVAQLETLVSEKKTKLIAEMVDKLSADGLIIHVNPLQEWLQPEGDRFEIAPLTIIKELINKLDIPLIVKEVGQGMGYESLKALLELPLAAVDFAANGGTNFAKVELLRSDEQKQNIFSSLALVGHSAEEMTIMTNHILEELGEKALCKEIIISGGVQDFLDGYYLINKLNTTAIYGQASAFLKHARGDYESLSQYVDSQIQGLELSQALLRVKK